MFESPFFHSLKSELKENLSLSLPLVASQITYATSGFIGVVMIAELGKDALAASILVSMIWWGLLVLFFGILNSISVLVSQQNGAGNHEAITKILGQSYILGAIIYLVMLLVLNNISFLFKLSEQPPVVLDLAKQYINSLIWTLPQLIVLIVGEQFLIGLGRTKLVLGISLIVVPIEIPMMYILIFGKLGLPAFGIAGIGYGLAITFLLTAICLTLYLLFSKKYRHNQMMKNIFQIHFNYLKELIVVGLPIGLMHFIEVSAFAVATFWMGQFGTTVLAAHQIVFQFLGFFITIVFAMSQSITTRVGYEVGKENLPAIKFATYVGLWLNFSVMFFISAAFYLFPAFFLQFDFNVSDPKNIGLLNYAAQFLAIVAWLMLFENFRIIGFGALRGLKDTTFSMLVSFISFWLIGLSTAYLLAFILHWQGNGVWWGLTFGIACGAVIIFLRFLYIIKRVDLKKLSKI